MAVFTSVFRFDPDVSATVCCAISLDVAEADLKLKNGKRKNSEREKTMDWGEEIRLQTGSITLVHSRLYKHVSHIPGGHTRQPTCPTLGPDNRQIILRFPRYIKIIVYILLFFSKRLIV